MRVLLLLALFVAFWLERLVYREQALGQVDVRLRFDSDRTIQDLETDLVLEVTHQGYLPLPWLEIKIPLPVELESQAKHLGSITAVLRVPYRATLERRYRIRPTMRGNYHIADVHVTVGDLFGSVHVTEDHPVQARLLVRPEIRTMDLPAREAVRIGLLEHRSLFEDPTAFRGIRDYQPSDPLKRIHWPKTAQLGHMVVREYASAAEYRVCLLVNLATTEPHWRATDRDRVEAVISTAAGIAWAAADLALPCELWVNAPAFEATAITHLEAGAGSRHLETMLDLMGRLAISAAESPTPLIARASESSDHQGLVFITSSLEPPWAIALTRAAQREPVTIVLVSDDHTSHPAVGPGVRLVPIRLHAEGGGPATVDSRAGTPDAPDSRPDLARAGREAIP